MPTRVVLLLISVGIFSCSRHSIDSASSRPLVVGADANLSEEDARSQSTVAVSYVFGEGGESFHGVCSGVLVAQNLVLTAAHCLTNAESVRAVFFGANVKSGAVPTAIDSFAIHPQYKNVLPESTMYDVAWIKLKGPLPPGARPVHLHQGEITLQEKGLTTLVGYGQLSSFQSSPGDKLNVDLPVLQILNQNKMGNYVYSNVIVTGMTPNKGACFGDSGGPLFHKKNGNWEVVGLVHGVDIFPEFSQDRDLCSIGKTAFVAPGAYSEWISKSSEVELNWKEFKPFPLPKCGDGLATSPKFGGYCAPINMDEKPVVQGPFSSSMIDHCKRSLDGPSCAESVWPGSRIQNIMQISSDIYPKDGQWASVDSVRNEKNRLHVTAMNNGTFDPVATSLNLASEGKFVVGWDDLGNKESIKYCLKFSTKPNQCQMFITIYGETGPKGRCTWTVPEEGAEYPYAILGVTESRFSLNPHADSRQRDNILGWITGGSKNEKRPVKGQTVFDNNFGQGLTIEDHCPVALPLL